MKTLSVESQGAKESYLLTYLTVVVPKGTIQMQRKWLKLEWPRLVSFTYNSDITTNIPRLFTWESPPENRMPLAISCRFSAWAYEQMCEIV